MSSNICFLLLILFILVILFITSKIQKKDNLQENFVQEEVEELIDTTGIQDSAINNLMLITKLDIEKPNVHPKFPDKHLIIEGTNLEKVTDVFFGDLRGIRLGEPEINGNKTTIRVMPPNFSKFTKMKKKEEFENIEIKLKIDDPVDGDTRDVKFNDANGETLTFGEDMPYASVDDVSPNRGILIVNEELKLDTTETKKVKFTFNVEIPKE